MLTFDVELFELVELCGEAVLSVFLLPSCEDWMTFLSIVSTLPALLNSTLIHPWEKNTEKQVFKEICTIEKINLFTDKN